MDFSWLQGVADAIAAFLEPLPNGGRDVLSLIGVVAIVWVTLRVAGLRFGHEFTIEEERRRQANIEHWRDERRKPYEVLLRSARYYRELSRIWPPLFTRHAQQAGLCSEVPVRNQVATLAEHGWDLDERHSELVTEKTMRALKSAQKAAVRFVHRIDAYDTRTDSDGMRRVTHSIRHMLYDMRLDWSAFILRTDLDAAITSLREDLGLETLE